MGKGHESQKRMINKNKDLVNMETLRTILLVNKGRKNMKPDIYKQGAIHEKGIVLQPIWTGQQHKGDLAC